MAEPLTLCARELRFRASLVAERKVCFRGDHKHKRIGACRFTGGNVGLLRPSSGPSAEALLTFAELESGSIGRTTTPRFAERRRGTVSLTFANDG
jgi:hypothetical protein